MDDQKNLKKFVKNMAEEDFASANQALADEVSDRLRARINVAYEKIREEED